MAHPPANQDANAQVGFEKDATADTVRTSEADPVYVSVPATFDPEATLPDGLKRHADCARYFVAKVVKSAIYDPEAIAEFTPIKAEFARRFFPSNDGYKATRDALIVGGDVESDNHYIPGEKSMAYRVTRRHSESPLRRVEILDKRLAGKVRNARLDALNAPRPEHRHLLYWLREVEFDYQSAMEWLWSNPDFDAEGYPVYHATNLEVAARFRDDDLYFRVCDFGRVHTPVTCLKGELRQYLSYRGRKLVNLDVRNSQPLMLAILLRKQFEGQGEPCDVGRYIALCETGRFYDHLMEKAGVPPESRSQFKQRFFCNVFFGKPERATEDARLFAEEFPVVSRFIRAMKTRTDTGLAPKLRYAYLAQCMQRAESDLMIRGVVGRLAVEHPEAFILTVHDSIMTTPDRAKSVAESMAAEFTRIGLNPTIKIEPA